MLIAPPHSQGWGMEAVVNVCDMSLVAFYIFFHYHSIMMLVPLKLCVNKSECLFVCLFWHSDLQSFVSANASPLTIMLMYVIRRCCLCSSIVGNLK